MAAAPSQDPADYPLDPIEYYDQAAPTYEDNSMNLKDVVRHLVTLGPMLLSPDSVVLGNACGPGTVTGEIFAQVPMDSQPKAIYATDGSARMIQVLNQKKAIAIQWERVDSHVIDSQDLHNLQDGMFTHIYMNFSLCFISHPQKAASEIHYMLTPTGAAFITSWALLSYVPLLQRAQHAVRPDLPVWLGPVPQVWMQSEKLVETLKAGCFRAENIVMSNYSVSMKFKEWTMDALIKFSTSSVIMITKGWSDQEKATFDKELRNDFMEARENEEEVEMKALMALGSSLF